MGKSIKFKIVENYKTIIEIRRNFGCHLPNGVVSIENINKENLDIPETLTITKQICLILSLLLAENIFHNKSRFSDKFNNSVSFYKKQLVNNSTGERYVYEKGLNKYLPVLLSEYSKLGYEEQKCIQTTVSYLNSTSNKYFEDQILAIAQIWEILSDTFLIKKVENNPKINELRSSLKTNIRDWHKSNENINYDLGFIMNRVLSSLDWEKAIKKMELLAIQEKLAIKKLGLDFRKLVDIRNQIAHSGRFKEIGKEYEYLELYRSSLIGIHVLLLKKLGYSGTLTEYNGGIPRTKRIDNLIEE